MVEQCSTTAYPPPSSALIVYNWLTVVSRNTLLSCFRNQNNKPLPKLSSNQSEILNCIFFEKDERERRKNKLLIFGVNKSSEESNEANKQVESIFFKIAIEPSVIAHSRRFKQNDVSKPAPILYVSRRLQIGTMLL